MIDDKLAKTIDSFKAAIAALRTGRANPDILSKVFVQYYGSTVPLKKVSSITVSDGNILVITPFDRQAMKDIERAIQTSGINVTPQVDATVIRLRLPDLTEDRRKELIKEAHREAESAKIAARNIRRDAIDTVKKQEKDKEISEDDSKKHQETIQKATDKAIAEIESLIKKKETEILTV